jgi:hypothetical protein
MSIELPENVAKQLSEYFADKGGEKIDKMVVAEKLSLTSITIHHVQLNMKDGSKRYFKARFEVTRTPNGTNYNETKRLLDLEEYTEGVKAKGRRIPLKPRKPKIEPVPKPKDVDPSIFGFNF